MSRVSDIEISSSQELKKPPKISPRDEKLFSQGPPEASIFLPGANCKVFFNPRDEDISIPDS